MVEGFSISSYFEDGKIVYFQMPFYLKGEFWQLFFGSFGVGIFA